MTDHRPVRTGESIASRHPPPPPWASPAAILRPASLIALGNVLSRLLGLVRESVIADLFGATGLVSAFRVAAVVPTMLHDLLVGGMISSALVPVFSEYADGDEEELWRLGSLIISLAAIVLGVVTLLGEAFAAGIAWLLGSGFSSPLLSETAALLRITLPAVLFLSLSSILTGLLYALRRFAFPAFTTAAYNAAIVLVALLASRRWGIRSLALGLLLGAILQTATQVPGLASMRFRPRIALRDPGLRRILRLFWPIFAGLLVSQIAVGIDRNLASRTGEQSIAWMQYATTLIQFPLGLVSAAISLALLPSLSRYAPRSMEGGRPSVQHSLSDFHNALAQGLRLVLLLIIPATVGLLLLAVPVVQLLFEHGDFTAHDTSQTALALRLYLIGLTFAAIDQPLIFAFYALQDTLTPALVGVLSVAVYLVVALLLLNPLGMTALVLANSAQWVCHALVMLWLLRRRAGARMPRTVWVGARQALVAAALMGAAVLFASWQLGLQVPGETLLGRIVAVLLPTALGATLYAGTLAVLRVEELRSALRWVASRFACH